MFKSLFNDIRHFIVVYRVRQLRKQAQALADSQRCQVFCVKINGRPRLLTKAAFKELRSKGYFPRQFTAVELKDLSLFSVKPSYLNQLARYDQVRT